MIRQLGAHIGKRVYFGYDRYVVAELPAYREQLRGFGDLLELVELERLHYLTSAELTCRALQVDEGAFGILCCGTGMGMSIAANKFSGIYAARCMTLEDAELARTINNANVLCIAANRGFEYNRAIIDAFARTPDTGSKLDELEYITEFESAPAALSTPVPVTPARVLRRTA